MYVYVCICMYIYVYKYILSYLFQFGAVVVVVVEVRRNASPENWCRYCLMNDFNGLTVDDIIAIFSDGWVLYVPLFEININIVVAYCLRSIIVGGGLRCRSLPFWQKEFFRLDDDFRHFSKTRTVDD